MKLVLRHLGADRRQLHHLVTQRLWVRSAEGVPTTAAVGRLEGFRLIWGQCSSQLTLVPGLAAGLMPRRRPRRAALDGGRVARGWLRGVRGVLVQLVLQVPDLLLERLDLGPQGQD